VHKLLARNLTVASDLPALGRNQIPESFFPLNNDLSNFSKSTHDAFTLILLQLQLPELNIQENSQISSKSNLSNEKTRSAQTFFVADSYTG
jgi:hypothetical protein